MNNEDHLYIVLSLNQWDKTVIELSIKERLRLLITGKLDKLDLVGHNSGGWVPVFEDETAAQEYTRNEAPGADIIPVKRQPD